MIGKVLKFWPVAVFLAGAYMGFAKLQWQVSHLDKVVSGLEREVKEHHDRFVRWEGAREVREARDRSRGR